MKENFVAKAFLIVTMLLIGGGLWACSEDRVRFRLTYTIETPDGEKTASHVLETSRWQGGGFTGRYSYGYRGEAAIIDLGAGKLLFALLRPSQGSASPDRIMWLPEQAYWSELRAQCRANPTPGSYCNIQDGDVSAFKLRQLEARHYPMLVTFDDINDPKTVKLVDPANLAATFGDGFSLKSITIEITDEKVTEGKMESVLGWLSEYRSKSFRLNGTKCVACPVDSESLVDLLGTGSFKVEEK
jgi:hypothetical protein